MILKSPFFVLDFLHCIFSNLQYHWTFSLAQLLKAIHLSEKKNCTLGIQQDQIV